MSTERKKLKIGIVSQAYFPIHGGLSEHVHHSAVELAKRGHDVRIITAYFNRNDEEWNWNNRVYRLGRDITLPANGAFVNVTFATNLGRRLREIEAKEKFDVVQIHQPIDPFLPLAACMNITAPKVGTFHTYKQGGSRLYSLLRGTANRHVNQLAMRIAVSQAAIDFIRPYCPGDYRIIPDAVDDERFRPDLPKIEQFADGQKNVLFVGRMDPRKGLKYLLKAWPAIAKAHPGARLIIVGGGFLGQYYRRFVAPKHQASIFWQGYVSNADLPRYFATADVYCAPSIRGESFGIVLIEAMAAGAPIVASDITGYNAVARAGQEASLATPCNPQALATAINELLGDDARRAQLRQAGLERVRTSFSWPRVAEQLEQAFYEVVK